MAAFRSLLQAWSVCIGFLIFFLALFTVSPVVAHIAESDSSTRLEIVQTDRDIGASAPLMFIENMGQFGAGADYQMQGANHTIWVAKNALWITLLEPEVQSNRFSNASILEAPASITGVNIRLAFVGANANPRLEPFNSLDTRVSFFTGNDPAKWHAEVPVWGGVRYVDLYPGIDLELRGERGYFQPRLVVHDPTHLDQVRLSIEGAEDLTLLSTDGADHGIQLTTNVGTVVLPLLSLVRPNGTVFEWNSAPSLVEKDITTPFTTVGGVEEIQQRSGSGEGLLYSTFLGGANEESGFGAVVDSAGNFYFSGRTSSTTFPTTPGVFDNVHNGDFDAFVTKLNPTGSALLYSTFLGGANQEFGLAIALDTAGNAYVTGRTRSGNFPTTPGSYDQTFNGVTDAFVTKLNANGSALIYSTFLGGTGGDVAAGIALDAANNAFITGPANSSNFPTTSGAFDTTYNGGDYDAFVTKLNATGSALVYSTFLGGSNEDRGYSVKLDTAGNAYLIGVTQSPTFPTTAGAFDTILNGYNDAFVSKLNATGSALIYSTFLGGGSAVSEEEAISSLALDTEGNAYLVGQTNSVDFRTTLGAFDTTYNGGSYDAFVTKLNAAGSALSYSTFLGGVNDDYGYGIALDVANNTYITGGTNSTDFPTTLGVFDTTINGNHDVFVTKLNIMGSALTYSTFLGGVNDDFGYGITLDAMDNAYLTGSSTSPDFPTTLGSFDTTYNGSLDAFVTKLAPMSTLPTVTPTATVTNTPTAISTVTPTVTGTPNSPTPTVSATTTTLPPTITSTTVPNSPTPTVSLTKTTLPPTVTTTSIPNSPTPTVSPTKPTLPSTVTPTAVVAKLYLPLIISD